VTADVTIHAQGIAYLDTSFTAPAGKPFTLAFVNEDQGTPHNVELKNASGAVAFKGEIFSGVATRVYEVPALPAGTYPYVCSVHSNMTGPRRSSRQRPIMPRRPILLALLVAVVTTAAILVLVRGMSTGTDDHVAVGQPAPAIAGTTLDGAAFDLASLRGKPVVVNFWGPSCVPAAMSSPCSSRSRPSTRRTGSPSSACSPTIRSSRHGFVGTYGGDWATVVDPDKAIKTAYRSSPARRRTSSTDPGSSGRSRSAS